MEFLLLVLVIIIIIIIRDFHISVSRWFFTGVLMTASLLKSPGLFSVFWPFSIMLLFGWSPPVRKIQTPPIPLATLIYCSKRIIADDPSLEFESPQVSRTLFNILAVLNNVVVWMVSIIIIVIIMFTH